MLPAEKADFSRNDFEFEKGYNSVLNNTLSLYARTISSGMGSSSAVTAGFFSWIQEETRRLLNSERYSGLMLKVSTLKSCTSDKGLSRDMIVGNENMVSELDGCIRLLFLYDLDSRSHPHIKSFGPYPQRVLAVGSPGCGKSFTLEVMVEEARELSAYSSKPLFVHDISAHLKSKYFGESAKNFRKIFDEVDKGDSLHILLADDVDTVIFSRDAGEQSENISIFGEFIRGIESVTASNKGNYLLFATTNRPDSLDQALYRRFQSVLKVKGPSSPQEYELLLRMKLSGYENNGLVKVSDWKTFGKKLYKNNVSGSVVADIATDLSKLIVDTGFDDCLFRMQTDKLMEELKNNYRAITDEDVLSVFKKRDLDK